MQFLSQKSFVNENFCLQSLVSKKFWDMKFFYILKNTFRDEMWLICRKPFKIIFWDEIISSQKIGQIVYIQFELLGNYSDW